MSPTQSPTTPVPADLQEEVEGLNKRWRDAADHLSRTNRMDSTIDRAVERGYATEKALNVARDAIALARRLSHHPQPAGAELLPCPFCGGTDIRFDRHHSTTCSTGEVWSMCCYNCGAQFPPRCSKEPMVAAWNRRSPAPAPAPTSEEDQRDAERYRWLRDTHEHCNLFIKDRNDKTLRAFGTPMLDAAIDAARAKERAKS